MIIVEVGSMTKTVMPALCIRINVHVHIWSVVLLNLENFTPLQQIVFECNVRCWSETIGCITV